MSENPGEPGWYSDPEGKASHEGYWDGEKWTGETRPPPPTQTESRIMSVFMVLGVVLILGVLAALLRSLDETYGNVTEGGTPLLALGAGVGAAFLAAAAVTRWNPETAKWVRNLVIAAVAIAALAIYAVAFTSSNNVIFETPSGG